MHGRRKTFPVFIVFFLLSLLIFVFSQKGWTGGLAGVFQAVTLPVQRSSFLFFHSSSGGDENIDLRVVQAAKVAALEKDNRALRDQFAVTNPSPKILLPAYIVGMPAFLPGVSTIDEIIIDKGSGDKVGIGNSVVFKDNLIGNVIKTSPHLSVVYLLNHKDISFTAKTAKTSALGIIQGSGIETMVLKNVLLSDTLQKGDTVVTKGDMQVDGSGFAPNLVIGKIIFVNKKASELFQSAEVERLVDPARLEMVFVVLGDGY